MDAPSSARTGAKTPTTIKGTAIYAIHNNDAKHKSETSKNNRKYTILTIDGQDYNSTFYNMSKRLESKLNRITNNKHGEYSKGHTDLSKV